MCGHQDQADRQLGGPFDDLFGGGPFGMFGIDGEVVLPQPSRDAVQVLDRHLAVCVEDRRRIHKGGTVGQRRTACGRLRQQRLGRDGGTQQSYGRVKRSGQRFGMLENLFGVLRTVQGDKQVLVHPFTGYPERGIGACRVSLLARPLVQSNRNTRRA